jgi:hypothetical protein
MQKTVALCLLYCLNGEVRFRKWFTKRAFAYARAQEAHDARMWYANVQNYYPRIERRLSFYFDLLHALPSNCDVTGDRYTIMKLPDLCDHCRKHHLDYRTKLWKKIILNGF